MQWGSRLRQCAVQLALPWRVLPGRLPLRPLGFPRSAAPLEGSAHGGGPSASYEAASRLRAPSLELHLINLPRFETVWSGHRVVPNEMAVYAQANPVSPALEAYERLAPVYDLLTAGYDHPTWLDSLETLALEHGLEGHRLLDVACGTGKSFMPMLARGYEVSACDVSPAMVELARVKVDGTGSKASLFVADMRALPPLAPVDLITCLDDAVNYLVSAEDLSAALASMACALAPGGLIAFDVNTLATY